MRRILSMIFRIALDAKAAKNGRLGDRMARRYIRKGTRKTTRKMFK